MKKQVEADQNKQIYNKPPPNYTHKTHTFSSAPSIPQILVYILVAGQVIVFAICINQIFTEWILIGVYIGTLVLMIISTAIISFSDPTDPIVYRYNWYVHAKQSQRNESLSKIKYSETEINFDFSNMDNYFCDFCDSFCGVNSKHCRTCDRCVPAFDHHCVWVNNCIGKKNYHQFFVMIILTFFQFSVFIASAIIATVKFEESGQNNDLLKYMIPIWVWLAIFTVFDILLLVLIVFHIYLKCRGITTFQFYSERKIATMKAQDNQNAMRDEQQIVIKNQSNNRDQIQILKITPAASQDPNYYYDLEPINKKINQGNIFGSAKESDDVKEINKMAKSFEYSKKRNPYKRNSRTFEDESDNQKSKQQQSKKLRTNEDKYKLEMRPSIRSNKSQKFILGSVDVQNPKKSDKISKFI